MSERRRMTVDGRGEGLLVADGLPGFPALPGLPPIEPTPELLTDAFTASGIQAGPGGHRRRGPIAAMPVVAEGTRTEGRTINIYNVIDVSPSNGWTDPEDARFLDFAFMARDWAASVIPTDAMIQVLFDSLATVYPACLPHEVPEDGFRHRPTPSLGGTCFVPPVQAVVCDAQRYPDRASLLVMYSDGMGGDVAEANALLTASGIPAVLIPYGPDFPWISAQWEHTAFQIAAHVDDRRHAIAQTVALAVLSVTGHRRAS